MKAFDYKATVVVPVYNAQDYLEECLESLIQQSIEKDQLEVLLIDDGSTDASVQIEEKYAERYSWIRLCRSEHKGVSAARNKGIILAKGRYIFFLDSDDKLGKDTVESVTDFFVSNDDQIDLVTYYIDYLQPDGNYRGRHYRYRIMDHTGVYDLTEGENIYISQSTMNVCVRNGDHPILFDESMRTSEDQKFNLQTLQNKLRIGFCADGQYIYRQHAANGASSLSNFAYYAFEGEIRFWEETFAAYEGNTVPGYVQALFLYQIDWKSRWDKLLPYHYDKEQFEKAKRRIVYLLNQVDTEVILNHPQIQNRQKLYLLSQKTNTRIQTVVENSEIHLSEDGIVIPVPEEIEIVINRFKREKEKLLIGGIVDSEVFYFLDRPELYYRSDLGKETKIELQSVVLSLSEALSREIPVWSFLFELNWREVKNFQIFLKYQNRNIKVRFKFESYSQPFSDHVSRYEYSDGICFYRFSNGFFHLELTSRAETKKWLRNRDRVFRNNRWTWITRKLSQTHLTGNGEIWIYTDCRDEFSDNGWYQFVHDVEKKDGVGRYYALNASDYMKAMAQIPEKYHRRILQFGGRKHKILFLKAKKLLASYYDSQCIIPFDEIAYDTYREVNAQPEIIYLQHGVLHAHLPQMYSYQCMWIDKEVVSTQFEKNNLKEMYHFPENSLITSGMPRYDIIKQTPAKRRILFAPSWRSYLLDSDGKSYLAQKGFRQSVFYTETQKLLNSPSLFELLEEFDFEMDFRLHRNFSVYSNGYFQSTCNRIHLNERKRDEADYDIFITDFSSYEFDFVYNKRAILYFFPDEELFKAGLNHYRKLDLPHEKGFGETVRKAEDAIASLRNILERGCAPENKYLSRMEGMFFYHDTNNRERLYQTLMKEN